MNKRTNERSKKVENCGSCTCEILSASTGTSSSHCAYRWHSSLNIVFHRPYDKRQSVVLGSRGNCWYAFRFWVRLCGHFWFCC